MMKFEFDESFNNFVIVDNFDKAGYEQWTKKGFLRPEDTGVYCFHFDPCSQIVLEKSTIEIVDFKGLLGVEIHEVCTRFGTYGMGGLGFIGFKILSKEKSQWVVINDGSDRYRFVDGRMVEAENREREKEQNAWFHAPGAGHVNKKMMNFYNQFIGMTIEEINKTEEQVEIHFIGKGNQEHIFISQKDNSRIFLIEDGTDIISV